MPPKIKIPAKDVIRRRGQSIKETKETPAKPSRTPAGRLRKVDKPKLKAKRVRRKLKGWLATPADWTRFNAWAKINALPKKYPEPEPIVRLSRPLFQLKKRIKILAKPKEKPDESIHCKFDFPVSKMALKAIPSKRLILLALPKTMLVDFGRIYYQVSPAALKYQPTQRIIELSMPRGFIKEEGKPPRLQISEKRVLDEERLKKLSLAKKLLDHSEQLTKEELEELFTPYGIKRIALLYQITPWVSFLAMPSYRRIKDKKDEQSKTFKKTIIEEEEKRGKEAFAEHKRREEEKRRGKKRSRKTMEADVHETEEEERKAKRRKLEKYAWRFAPYPCVNIPIPIKRAALKAKASPRMVELAKARDRKCKSLKTDPFTVKKSALKATATEKIESLAIPKSPRSPVERKPPREKDKFGKPIFKMPVYGKVLPKTKPYKMGECPEPKKEKPPAKKRPIDPIIYEATYDPCIYPDLAKRQKIERKRAEKLLKKKPRRKKGQKKKSKRPEYRDTAEAEDKKEEVEGKETDEAVDKTETEATEETEVTEGTDVTEVTDEPEEE